MNDYSFMPTATRTIDPDAKRAAVLDAALDLFAARTFAGTAMPDLARQAGVAAGTVYRYFPSKEALVNAVFQQWKTEMGKALLPPMADTPAAAFVDDTPAADTPAAIRAEFDRWWGGLVAFSSAHPVAFAFLELHRHEPYLDADSRAIAAAIDAEADAFVARGQRAGVLRAGPPDLVTALAFGAFVGLRKAEERRGRAFSTAELETARAATWALVAAPAAPPDDPMVGPAG